VVLRNVLSPEIYSRKRTKSERLFVEKPKSSSRVSLWQ
jgi:hypothetical protein